MNCTPLAPLVFAVLLSTSLASPAPQFERAWQFGYQAPGQSSQLVRELVAAPDGGALTVVTTAEDANGGAGLAVLTKFSANGEREWELSRPTFVCGLGSGCIAAPQQDAAVDSLGNVYWTLLNSDPQLGGTKLLKLSPGGTLLWEVPVTSPQIPSIFGGFVAVDSTDQPVVGGTRDIALYPHSAAFKFDAAGNLLWTAGGNTRCEVVGMEMGPQDQIALYGRNDYPAFAQLYFGVIHVYAADGSVQYQTGLSSDGFGTLNFGTFWGDTVGDVAFDSLGNLHAFTNGSFGAEWFHPDWVGFAIAQFDVSGSRVYRTAVDSPRDTSGTRIAVDNVGNAYVVGAEDLPAGSNAERHTTVWKVDAAGDLEWQRVNPTQQSGSTYGMAIGRAATGDMLISATAGPDTLHFAMDSDGNTPWQAIQPGGPPAPATNTPARAEILTDASGMTYSMAPLDSSIRLTKWVPGTVVGAPYCGPAAMNSTGLSGLIDAIGSDTATSNNLTLRLTDLPGNTFALLLNSQSQGSGPTLGGGQGTLCLGGSIGRFVGPNELRRTLADGTSSLRIDTARIPNGQGNMSVSSGQTWNFQAWFRDLNPAVTSNLTNAVAVTFQ